MKYLLANPSTNTQILSAESYFCHDQAEILDETPRVSTENSVAVGNIFRTFAFSVKGSKIVILNAVKDLRNLTIAA